MKIFSDLEDIPPLPSPIALTIGSFDGIHLGHQRILNRLEALAPHGTRIVLTFCNHPSEVLSSHPFRRLISLEQKLALLETFHIDIAVVLTFTKPFAEQTYRDFLTDLHAKIPFSFLVLGEGATLGKDRKGDQPHLEALGQKLGFTPEFLQKTCYQDTPISSRAIRQALDKGDLKTAKALLGREYSLLLPLCAHIKLPFPLLLPPGLYHVKVGLQKGIASLSSSQQELDLPFLQHPPKKDLVTFLERFSPAADA